MPPRELLEKLLYLGEITLDLRVTPRAPRTEFSGQMADGTWKLRVAAVPEDGKANAEIIRFLAEWASIPRHNIHLLRGATSTRKSFRLLA